MLGVVWKRAVLLARPIAYMGAFQSSNAAAHPDSDMPTAASPGYQQMSPTKVEMEDGRVISYDSYIQHSIGRFMPARSTRRTKATPHVSHQRFLFADASHQADAAAPAIASKAPRGIAKASAPSASSRSRGSSAQSKPSPTSSSIHKTVQNVEPSIERPQPAARVSAARAAASPPPPQAAAAKAPVPPPSNKSSQPPAVLAPTPNMYTSCCIH